MPGKNRKWSVGVIALVSLCLVAFVSYKAAHTSFTHDESFTTLHFFPQSEINILLYRHPYTSVITNNHIFNTYMMKLSESLFGFSEWALRLPNILSLVSYLFFAFALLRSFRPRWVQLFAFLLLVANPYLLDFFGLARGYGLSIGLMMGSLYYLIRFLNQETGRSLFAFHLMGILSVMSNFALLNFYVVAICCLYAIFLLGRSAGKPSLLNSWRFHGWNMLAVLITAGLLYAPFKVILANNTVSFGGKQGFFTDTILSVVRRSMYEMELSDTLLKGLGYLVCFLVIFPTIIVLIRLTRQRLVFLKHFTALAVCNALCLGIALLTTIQHYLLEQDFLMDRFAVFLYPLFILNVIFFLDWMWQQKPGKKMAFAGMLTLTLIMTLHTASKLNIDFLPQLEIR